MKSKSQYYKEKDKEDKRLQKLAEASQKEYLKEEEREAKRLDKLS